MEAHSWSRCCEDCSDVFCVKCGISPEDVPWDEEIGEFSHNCEGRP